MIGVICLQLLFFFFSDNAHSSELSINVVHGRSAGSNRHVHISQADKKVQKCADKTGL